MLPIVDGAINYRGASLAEVAATKMAEEASRVGFVVPALDQIAAVSPLPARIDHNRLIVDCPDCRGAELVWREGPHIVMCRGCWNAMVGHRWRPVALPDELPAIERALLARPMPATRNWQRPETVKDLLAENLEHAAELRPLVEG